MMKIALMKITMFACATLILLMIPLLHAGVVTGAQPAASAWQKATGPRAWSFPHDHGAHPDYRTEWWYFTGNLRADQGRNYGYQLTFFRRGIAPSPKNPATSWSLRDIYPAHFALSDIGRADFRFTEQVSRTGPGLAGALTGEMKVWSLRWSARMAAGKIFLNARMEDAALNLELAARKPPVLHGVNGLSKKGPQEGNASYYYSLTDLATTGILRSAQSGADVPVTGTSWFDHEFGSNQLARDQVGWDWFGVHLTDGRDIMLYFLRKKDGSLEAASAGTLVEKTGQSRQLRLADIQLEVLATWKSPKSGARYPSRWRVRVPAAGLDLTMAVLIADQELDTSGSTGVVYYEGALGGRGKSAGRAVNCEGYVEMTGYAGSLGGLI